jgi:hypothetical protein
LLEEEQLKLLVTRSFYCNDHFLHTLTTDMMEGVVMCERSWWKGRGAPAGAGSELDEEGRQLLDLDKEEAVRVSRVERFIREASKGLDPVGACKNWEGRESPGALQRKRGKYWWQMQS